MLRHATLLLGFLSSACALDWSYPSVGAGGGGGDGGSGQDRAIVIFEPTSASSYNVAHGSTVFFAARLEPELPEVLPERIRWLVKAGDQNWSDFGSGPTTDGDLATPGSYQVAATLLQAVGSDVVLAEDSITVSVE